MKIIDGKGIAGKIKEELAHAVAQMVKSNIPPPHLAAILVGNNGASEVYVRNKILSCKQIGFASSLIRLEESVTEKALLSKIEELNNDPKINGFIVQLPLPKHINEQTILQFINPEKDVDGFHPLSVGRMMLGLPTLLPATPAGIIELLRRYEIATEGKHCVVVGRSHIVGTPLSLLLSQKAPQGNATVTLCHSRTQNLKKITRSADILIAAMGVPDFITADMVQEGSVVIDVGTTRVPDTSRKSGYRLSGDVCFEQVAPKTSWITPVPGGVGPMTIASLLNNTLIAAKRKRPPS